MTYIAIPTRAAHLVRVRVEEEDGLFTATSPDLGLIVTGYNLGDEFHKGITQSIAKLFAAMGQTEPMKVIRVNHPKHTTGYWHFAAIPQCVLDEQTA